MNDIVYKTIHCNELVQFVHSPQFNSLQNIPVTIHRAVSLAQNPRANPEDPVLILAFKKNNLIGYVGLLPDKMAGEKFFWNSGWWIRPGENAHALQMMLVALKECDQKMLITDLTPHTLSILKNLRCFYFGYERIAYRYYLNPGFTEVFPDKFKLKHKIKPLLKIFDGILNKAVKTWRKMLFKPNHPFHVEFLSEINEEVDRFVIPFQKKELTQRRSKEFNWILNNKWILPENKDTQNEKSRYYFSSFEPGFKQNVLLFKNNDGEIKGFVLFTIRKNNLRVDYLYAEEKYMDGIANFLIDHCLKNNIRSFTTTAELLKAAFTKYRWLFIVRKKIPIQLAISTKIKLSQPGKYQLQMGDGDVVFT